MLFLGVFLLLKILPLFFFSPSDDNESAVKRGYLANEYDFQGMKTRNECVFSSAMR